MGSVLAGFVRPLEQQIQPAMAVVDQQQIPPAIMVEIPRHHALGAFFELEDFQAAETRNSASWLPVRSPRFPQKG